MQNIMHAPKHPVVHISVRWVAETPKYLAFTEPVTYAG